MSKILVIGGVSFDVLHLAGGTVSTIGGAGMYAAMAAHRCGSQVSLFGPRPDPCPEAMQPVANNLAEWLGPLQPVDELSHFEIDYREGKTEYLNQSFDSETQMDPSALPLDLSKYDHVHVAALGTAKKQLAFIRTCRQRGARQISAGTGMPIVPKEPETVRAIMEQTELFFMNQQEAEVLFGSLEAAKTEPGKVLYVTRGAMGACIIQGRQAALIPATPAVELDPTGAGETFCGATLAFLLDNKHPIMAARQAGALAAEMITQVGPAALFSPDPPPEVILDKRVRINDEQVKRIAVKVAEIPEMFPFPFVSPELPVVGDPKTVDFFFAATLQQFSFWYVQKGRYDRPMIAEIDGVIQKGSDYLWGSFKRQVDREPDYCSPDRQANLSRDDVLELYRADDGSVPMPAVDLHLEKARSYGQDMLALNLTPQSVLQISLASDQPLLTFIHLLDKIGGYKEDPLRKKSSLLAMILDQRPERYFPLRADEVLESVIDYHAQRFCLRVGLIDVVDEELRNKLANKQILSADEEFAVRYASYRAIERLTVESGKGTGAVDWYTYNARKRCPEMTDPECELCQVDPVCALPERAVPTYLPDRLLLGQSGTGRGACILRIIKRLPHGG